MDKEQRLWKVPEQKKKLCNCVFLQGQTQSDGDATVSVLYQQPASWQKLGCTGNVHGKSCFPCLMFLMRQLLSSDVQACKTAYMRLVKQKYLPLF